MARAKVSMRGKGKEVAESSRRGTKRARKAVSEPEPEESESEYEQSEEGSEEGSSEEDVDYEEEFELEFEEDNLPKWDKSKKLSRFPKQYQAQMFMKKIGGSNQNVSNLFLCERLIDTDSFAPFGVLECFQRLGWMDCLKFKGVENIYIDQIREWMSTLTKEDGSNPPVTTQLVGYVGEVKVVLSFDELKTLTKYDTAAKTKGDYYYPTNAIIEVKKAKGDEWHGWIRSLFDVPAGTNVLKYKLYKKNLHPFPRLLLWFITKNLLPRTSDRNRVRLFEVMILYSLLTGSPKLSARHLIMYNIWETRERLERKVIPYARLLSKMLKKQGAIPPDVRGIKKKPRLVTIPVFTKASKWRYEVTRRKHILYVEDIHRGVEGLRSDAEEEEEEEVEVRRENVMEEGIEANRDRVGVNTEEVVTPPVTGPVVLGLPPEMRGTPYYTYLHNSILAARPSDFSEWPNRDRIMFDRQSQQIAEGQVFQRAMMYRQEEMRNEDWVYQENIRRDQDFIRGYSQVVRPRPPDWGNPLLEPHAVSHRFPRYPQATPSPYISPYPQQQDVGTSGPPEYDIAALQRSFYEFSLGSPYTPPDYDGSSTL